jgi:hypothetical protein
VSLPVPEPGLLIRYAYLWDREASAGREDGTKDRPCAIVLAREVQEGETRVYVLPITHSAPVEPDVGIEIPLAVKQRLALDGDRSWVIISEANVFTWPGPDLRPIPGQSLHSIAYGFLPPRMFRVIRERYLALDAERRTTTVARTE